MRVKHGTTLLGLHPMMQVANCAAERAYTSRGYDLVITAGVEFGHSVTSLHPHGRACDYRTIHVKTEQEKRDIVSDLKQELGPDHDVVLESDHIHCEYDPKHSKLFYAQASSHKAHRPTSRLGA